MFYVYGISSYFKINERLIMLNEYINCNVSQKKNYRNKKIGNKSKLRNHDGYFIYKFTSNSICPAGKIYEEF